MCTDLKIEMRPDVPQDAAGRITVSEQVPQPENQCLGNSRANLLLIAALKLSYISLFRKIDHVPNEG